MLPAAVPEARIYTYNWDADYLHDAPAQNLRDHAATLLTLISEHRRHEQTPEKRPIIFIASCFGGLVLIEVTSFRPFLYLLQCHVLTDACQAINQAATQDSRYRDILLSVVGCVFLATPFQGSDASSHATWQVTIEGILGRGPGPSEVLVRALNTDHEELTGRARLFALTANANWLRLPVCCFFETKRSELLQRYVSRRWTSWLPIPKDYRLVCRVLPSSITLDPLRPFVSIVVTDLCRWSPSHPPASRDSNDVPSLQPTRA